LSTLAELVVRISGDTAQLTAALGRADKSTGGFHRTVNKLRGELKLMTLAAAAAMGAMAVASVKSAAAFEETMTRSVSLAGLLPEEVDKVTDALLKMAPAMGKSPQELAEAFYFASSAGLDTEKALAAVTWSAKAAAAGLGETKIIIDAVTSVMNAYSLSADQAGRVTDTLVAAVKYGKGEPDALAQSLGKVIPVASQMGVSFEEVSASMAIMTRIGLNAEESAVALRGVLMALLKPGAEAKTMFEGMGTSIEEVRKAIKERGLAAVLVEMVDALGGNDEALSKIVPNVRALTGVLATAGNQGEEYQKVLQAIKEELGVTDTAFTEASDTFSFKMGQLKASFDVLKISVGTQLIPVLTDLVEAINVDVLPAMTDWITANGPEIQQRLRDLAAGIKVIVDGFVVLGDWLTKNTATTVASLLAIGLALAWANPAFGIAAGITAIAFALGTLTTQTYGFKAAIENADWTRLGFPGVLAVGRAAQAAPVAEDVRRLSEGQNAYYEKIAPISQDVRRFNDLANAMKDTGTALAPLPGLFDEYGGGAEKAAGSAVKALSETEKGLLDLVAAANASGLSQDDFARFLDAAALAMDKYALSAEELRRVIDMSSLSLMEFADRIARLDALDDLTQRTKTATDAVNELYSAFNNAFARPTKEEAQLNLQLAKLRQERAERIAHFGFGPGVTVNTADFDEQIEAIQSELDVRRAQRDVDMALLDIANKTLMSDTQQKAAVDMITTAMGSASEKAQLLSDTLFWTSLALANWRDDMQRWVNAVTSNVPSIPSYGNGGIVPGAIGEPRLIRAHGGEEIVKAGARSGGLTNYGHMTVQVVGGSGEDVLRQLERRFR